MFIMFAAEFPSGEISLKEFVATCDRETQNIAERLFTVFDNNNSNSMDFYEYMLASNATSLRKPAEKLSWIFDVFDRVSLQYVHKFL